MAGISSASIHEFIFEHDRAALIDCDEDGEHAPLLLATLNLSQWTFILAVTIKKSAELGLERLKLAQAELPAILDAENEELELATQNAKLVEIAMRRANPHETSMCSTPTIGMAASAPHPLLCGIIIPQAQQAALEDLVSAIQTSQEEIDLSQLTSSGNGPEIPFTPARSIEYDVSQKGHRCWALPNINLLAPISIDMWRTWINLSPNEVEALKTNVVHNAAILKDPQNIPNSFPLALYDYHKCHTMELKIHTKQDVLIGYGRDAKFTAAIWNVQRPYLRCLCSKDARNGCRGDIMWFDHAIWYQINNLGVFFPDADFPTLLSKFLAFLTWLSTVARVAVRYQIAFAFARELMIEASLELVKDPNAKLLARHPDGTGIRKIKRLFKPAGFTASNPGTPSPSPSNKSHEVRSTAMQVQILPRLSPYTEILEVEGTSAGFAAVGVAITGSFALRYTTHRLLEVPNTHRQ